MIKNITIDGVTFTYVLTRSTKKKIYIRVKDGIVKVSSPRKTTIRELETLLKKNIDFIKKQLEVTKVQEIIHINNIGYKPKFLVGVKSFVKVDGNEILICAKKNDEESYKKVLREFYKKEVERELVEVIAEAECDFKEIQIPKITVCYMKRALGNYNRRLHKIKISSILAKYDFKFIKHVLYHELCHIFEFNHSKRFYDLFDIKYKNARRVNKELKSIKYYDCL